MWPDICMRARVRQYLQLVLHRQGNVDVLAVVPQEQASLEGMVPQKQGHSGGWMAGSNLEEAVVCWRGFEQSRRGGSINNPYENKNKNLPLLI